ncbi:HPP family-domain-containing protein [Mrakia frigida]|uniref:HPP family protein n=1 Tax=Mrakia frigida TaxID=29902 RepID=UPI003FCC1C6E
MQPETSISPPEPSLQPSRHRSPSVASSSFSPSPNRYGRSSRSQSTTRRFLLPRGRRGSSASSKSPGPPIGGSSGAGVEDFKAVLRTDDEERRGRSRGRRAGVEGRARAAAVQAFGDSAQQRRYDWVMGRLPPLVKHFLGWREHEGAGTGGGKPWLPILNHVSPQVESYLLAFVASLLGISSLLLLFDKSGFLQLQYEGDEKVLVIGSMGASLSHAASTRFSLFLLAYLLPLFSSFSLTGAAVVLLYSLPLAPPSQPRPVLLGQLVSSLIGCSISRLFSLAGPAQYSLYFSSTYADGGHVVWIAGALATSLSLAAMKATSSVHPPGGATALLSCTSKGVAKLGFLLVPTVLISSSILLLIALFLTNLTRLHYPVYCIRANNQVQINPHPTRLPLNVKASNQKSGRS